ncbi:MAG: VCBS repeat-containing protein [Planctomycetes bacterium]|nr:VCBS repeat-containing protein [Planctomycetota bacterium]
MNSLVACSLLALSPTLCAQAFGPAELLSEPSQALVGARSFDAVDLDGDGDRDVLAVGSWYGELGWYENLGGGGFAALAEIPSATLHPSLVVSGDLDGDGDLDVVVGGDSLSWTENLGGGQFGASSLISGVRPSRLRLADLDADGDLDVATTGDGLPVRWYENPGAAGAWSEHVVGSSTGSTTLLLGATEDLDADGVADLLVTTSPGRLARVRRNLGGSFAAPTTLSATDVILALPADLDGDSDLDVLVSGVGAARLAWCPNLGGGAFGAAQVISTLGEAPWVLVAADLDGDGDADVAGHSPEDDLLVTFENLGGGVFGARRVVALTTSEVHELEAADLDGDGDAELVAAAYDDDTLAYYENLGGLQFGAEVRLSPPSIRRPSLVSAVDWDRDGDLDALTLDGEARRLWFNENRGSGEFGTPTLLGAVEFAVSSIAFADLDGDGDVDVVGASSVTNEVAWSANVAGRLAPWTPVGTPIPGADAVRAADLDGDGDSDVLVSTLTPGVPAMWIESLGGGAFGSTRAVATDAVTSAWLDAVDLDSDGDRDVLSVGVEGASWFASLGGGAFGPRSAMTAASLAPAACAADFDGDGDVDLVATRWSAPEVLWLENLGAGTFAAPLLLDATPSHLADLAAADVDADGDLDLVTGSPYGDEIAWYENLGAPSFAPRRLVTSPVHGVASLAAADLDHDGDAEVLAALPDDAQVAWFEALTHVGAPGCQGDAAGSICPCGNGGGEGGGCLNSTGHGAALRATGSASLTLDDLAPRATWLPAGQSVLLFSGSASLQAAGGSVFGDGLRCAGGTLQRHGARVADAGGVAAWSPGLAVASGWSAGETRVLQAWYRDPVGGPCGGGFNLTNSLALTFVP